MNYPALFYVDQSEAFFWLRDDPKTALRWPCPGGFDFEAVKLAFVAQCAKRGYSSDPMLYACSPTNPQVVWIYFDVQHSGPNQWVGMRSVPPWDFLTGPDAATVEALWGERRLLQADELTFNHMPTGWLPRIVPSDH